MPRVAAGAGACGTLLKFAPGNVGGAVERYSGGKLPDFFSRPLATLKAAGKVFQLIACRAAQPATLTSANAAAGPPGETIPIAVLARTAMPA